jgi:hypothetical protein
LPFLIGAPQRKHFYVGKTKYAEEEEVLGEAELAEDVPAGGLDGLYEVV